MINGLGSKKGSNMQQIPYFREYLCTCKFKWLVEGLYMLITDLTFHIQWHGYGFKSGGGINENYLATHSKCMCQCHDHDG